MGIVCDECPRRMDRDDLEGYHCFNCMVKDGPGFDCCVVCAGKAKSVEKDVEKDNIDTHKSESTSVLSHHTQQ